MNLLSGNEAVAQGAWEAGVLAGIGYPGTPSTETLEYLAKLEGVYAEWAPNEKVALEVAFGVAMAGGRALMTTKHVGVNVAADPLFTAAYAGVNGGLVILAADDPGCHSSQNEQDSRTYAASARIPMFEPADSAEALAFTKQAFELSEDFDTPVFLRSEVRIAHTKSPVAVSERIAVPTKPYEKNAAKYVMVPANARVRRRELDARVERLRAWAETSGVNRIEMRDVSIGIICSGVCYHYVREALPQASILKLGMSYPLPDALIRTFAEQVEHVYVIEEIFDFYAMRVRALGIDLASTDKPLPRDGELSPSIIRESFGCANPESIPYEGNLPGRPPSLCPGCPHRLVFSELSRMRAIVTGDIGCYTLGASAPLSAIDSTIDMGASVSMAHGVELVKAFAPDASENVKKQPVVAVIGDSTFAHSGITSLLGTVYNQGAGIVCILDNRTTAMTGQQGNPVNGITLQNRPSRELDLPALVKALGVEDVRVVDAQDLQAIKQAFKAARAAEDTLSVIIFRAPCVLLSKKRGVAPTVSDACRACGVCTRIGCPALGTDSDGHARIDTSLCIGCGQCAQICPFGCILAADDGQEGE